MGTISVNTAWTVLEEMWDQLALSWPNTMNRILEEYKHEGQDFFIYTFFKWNTHIIPPTYQVYHQPRRSRPDAFPGTILREVSPTGGWAKIIWALPHQEGFRLYKQGKIFEDPLVNDSIRKYLSGELDREEESFNKV